MKAPPSVWGKVVVGSTDRHAADCIVAKTNFGGAMVEPVVQAAAASAKLRVCFKEVKASRGKVVRAEPVAALYEQGRVHHVGAFPARSRRCAHLGSHRAFPLRRLQHHRRPGRHTHG